MKDKTRVTTRYTFDMNVRLDRLKLRALALTFPVWGIVLPVLVFLSSHFSDREALPIHQNLARAGEFPILLVCALAFWQFFRRLRKVSTIKIIETRANKPGAKLEIESNLKEISLAPNAKYGQDLVLTLERNGRKKTYRAPVETLEADRVNQLLKIIDRVPQVEIDKDLRTELVKLKRKLQTRVSSARLVIPYASHMMMRRIGETILENERYFWYSWAITWGLVFILGSALALPNIIHWFATHFFGMANAYSPEEISRVLPLGPYISATLVAIFLAFAAVILPTIVALSFLSTNIFGQVFLAAGLIVTLYFLLKGFLEPNKLIADEKEIRTVLDIGFTEIVHNRVEWARLHGIKLNKPKEATDPARWQVRFLKDNNQQFDLNLGGIGNAQNKLDLLKIIEKYADNVPRDAEVETCLSAGGEVSYTDLWLTSLATPPKREKLAPLSEGHALKGGEYVIHRQYAAGGQGLTYLAAKVDDLGGKLCDEDCHIIVKESMLPLYVDEEARRKAVEKFEGEALLLKSLHSNYIVGLLDYFIEDHRSYLVLERIPGVDLRYLVEGKGVLSAGEVLDLAKKMTEIVSYLHMRTPPVVHRDFTPDNLVLEACDFEQSGKLKLIDFEVAHEHAQRTTATVVGKHSYIPPEQLRGKPVPASDLYAMGCTLYYLYTGHDPEPLSRSRLDAHLINSPEAQKLSDLIADLTTLDPAKRLSLNELRERMGMVRFETQEEALAQAPRDISHVIKIKETETIKEKA